MAEKILVVDDDPDTIDFLKLLLIRQGYQVLTAENGMQALKIAHSDHPDLIVLDIMMPDLDGYEVTRTLRGHPETATIPVLMFTAKTQIEDKVAGYEAGGNIYLTKPVHPVELQANIKALLAQRKVQVEKMVEQGYMVGVLAAKGGLGVSTLALNLAIAYHQKNNAPVIAAEMRPGQGSWGQELGIPRTDGLANLLKRNPSEITSSVVNNCLVLTNYGVRLLLANNKSDQIDLISAMAQYEAILQQLPLLGSFVVLDIGTNFLPAFDTVAGACQEMVVVIEPQPLAVKRTRGLMEDLRQKGFGSSRALTLVVVNRTRADMSLTLSQIEDELGHAVALGIPPAAEQAFRAAMQSVPLIIVQPESLLATQYGNLAENFAQRVAR